MQKIVIDTSIGGFSLGQLGREWLFDTAKNTFFREVDQPGLFSPNREAYEAEFLGESFLWSEDLWKLKGLGGKVWHFDSGFSEESPRAKGVLVRAVRVCEPDSKEDPQVVSIPDGVEWSLAANDAGQEFIREKHRTWP